MASEAKVQSFPVEGLTEVDAVSLFKTDPSRVLAPGESPKNSIPLAGMRLKWAFSMLTGEPLERFTADYSLADGLLLGQVSLFPSYICTPDGIRLSNEPVKVNLSTLPSTVREQMLAGVTVLSNTKFRIYFWDKDKSGARIGKEARTYRDVTADTIVRKGSTELRFSVWGSPSWDKMFKYQYSGTADPQDKWLSAEEAKEIFRRGIEVRRVELVNIEFYLSKTREVYEKYLRATCVPKKTDKKEDEKKADAPEKTSSPLEEALKKHKAASPKTRPEPLNEAITKNTPKTKATPLKEAADKSKALKKAKQAQDYKVRGDIYFVGANGETRNFVEAKKWYAMAAALEHPVALHMLSLYSWLEGNPYDIAGEPIDWRTIREYVRKAESAMANYRHYGYHSNLSKLRLNMASLAAYHEFITGPHKRGPFPP